MLYICVVTIDGKDQVAVSSVSPDSDVWNDNYVTVTLGGFGRQPDAHIAAGVVRNVLAAGGAQVTMES